MLTVTSPMGIINEEGMKMKAAKRYKTEVYACDCPYCGEMIDCGTSGDMTGLGANSGRGETKCESCGQEVLVK